MGDAPSHRVRPFARAFSMRFGIALVVVAPVTYGFIGGVLQVWNWFGDNPALTSVAASLVVAVSAVWAAFSIYTSKAVEAMPTQADARSTSISVTPGALLRAARVLEKAFNETDWRWFSQRAFRLLEDQQPQPSDEWLTNAIELRREASQAAQALQEDLANHLPKFAISWIASPHIQFISDPVTVAKHLRSLAEHLIVLTAQLRAFKAQLDEDRANLEP